MHGGRIGLKGRKGKTGNFHWNPEMTITPIDTESCVSWGFGAIMAPCCQKCAAADMGTCTTQPEALDGGARGVVGVDGGSKAFPGVSCDEALKKWQAVNDRVAALEAKKTVISAQIANQEKIANQERLDAKKPSTPTRTPTPQGLEDVLKVPVEVGASLAPPPKKQPASSFNMVGTGICPQLGRSFCVRHLQIQLRVV
jgi:hypothetical protein